MVKKKEQQPKNKKITLKLKYRDEKCRHCGDTFRAGLACEGYMDFNIVGYSGLGVERHGYFCNICMEEFVYRFMGESSILDFDRAPTKMYKMPDGGKKSRVNGMIIKGKYFKYDKKKFERATKKFVKWVKENEPWNVVDYEEYGGYKK